MSLLGLKDPREAGLQSFLFPGSVLWTVSAIKRLMIAVTPTIGGVWTAAAQMPRPSA